MLYFARLHCYSCFDLVNFIRILCYNLHVSYHQEVERDCHCNSHRLLYRIITIIIMIMIKIIILINIIITSIIVIIIVIVIPIIITTIASLSTLSCLFLTANNTVITLNYCNYHDNQHKKFY